MKLYYFETMNPRKACAAAKHLRLPVEYVKLNGQRGEHRTPEHFARNPNGRVPVLVDGERSIWESAAIMVYLAIKAGSDMWPVHDPLKQMDVVRWMTWDAFHFAPHAGAFYFEHYIKRMFGLGEPDPAALEQQLPAFHRSAKVLDAHLDGRKFLVGDTLTVADFCVGVLLPSAKDIHLPLEGYANIQRWHEKLMELPAWREPWPA